MEVERRIIFALNNKPLHFEKMPYYFSCTLSNIEKMVSIIFVHYFIIIGETFSCIFSASDSNYSFHANILSNK